MPPPVIVSFTATPGRVYDGGSATLQWSVSNVDEVSLDQPNQPSQSSPSSLFLKRQLNRDEGDKGEKNYTRFEALVQQT